MFERRDGFQIFKDILDTVYEREKKTKEACNKTGIMSGAGLFKSSHVDKYINHLVGQGLLEKKEKIIPSKNSEKQKKIISYKITKKGKEILDEMNKVAETLGWKINLE